MDYTAKQEYEAEFDEPTEPDRGEDEAETGAVFVIQSMYGQTLKRIRVRPPTLD